MSRNNVFSRITRGCAGAGAVAVCALGFASAAFALGTTIPPINSAAALRVIAHVNGTCSVSSASGDTLNLGTIEQDASNNLTQIGSNSNATGRFHISCSSTSYDVTLTSQIGGGGGAFELAPANTHSSARLNYELFWGTTNAAAAAVTAGTLVYEADLKSYAGALIDDGSGQILTVNGDIVLPTATPATQIPTGEYYDVVTLNLQPVA